jgi:hypothetical protein
MNKMMAPWVATILSVCWLPAGAQTAEDIAALRAEIDRLSARLAQLEAASSATTGRIDGLEQTTVATAAAVSEVEQSAGAASWTDRISWKGDFRYRYENIDQQGSNTRNRQRVRARPALTAQLNDTMKVGFGLATGSSDPVSSNQTLGGGGSSKGVVLDLAYFDWSGLDGWNLVGGKFKNPLEKPGGHNMLWDGDWRPEGFHARYSSGPFFGNVLMGWLESDSSSGSEGTFGGQAGYKLSVGEGMTLKAGLGYYHIDTAGRLPFFDPDDSFGNSLAPDGTYLFDFRNVELFADLSMTLGDQPATVFANVVKNTDADQFDTGWAIGFNYGKASAPGTWELGWAYQELEADATLGLVADSDFGGGGTDNKGHVFSGAYALSKATTFKVTYFLNEIGGNLGAQELDYDRLQVDLAFKY